MQKNFKQQINKISTIAKVETPEQLLRRYNLTLKTAIAELNNTVRMIDSIRQELQDSEEAWNKLPE